MGWDGFSPSPTPSLQSSSKRKSNVQNSLLKLKCGVVLSNEDCDLFEWIDALQICSGLVSNSVTQNKHFAGFFI